MTLRYYAHSKQSATLVVAASDSLHPERADYVCDGTADNVEIQAAIDALPGHGGTLLLLDGHYTISAQIDLDEPAILTGVGVGTIIDASAVADADSAIKVSAEYAEVHSMHLIGGGRGVGGARNGIYVYAAHVTCRDVKIEDFYYYGICVVRSYAVIDRCTTLTCGDDGIMINEPGHGTIVKNCFSSGHTGLPSIHSGIEMEDGAYNIAILNNVLDMSGHQAIEIHSHTDQNACHHILVRGNIVIAGNIGTQYEGNVDCHDIIIDGNVINGYIYIRSLKNVAITNNLIKNSSYCIYGYETGSGLADSIIANNIIESDNSFGILLSKASNITISGNHIKSVNSSCIMIKVYNDDTQDNWVITDNILVGSIGIGLENYDFKTFGDVFISNNNLTGVTTAYNGSLIKDGSLIYRQHPDLFMNVLAVSATHVVDDWGVSAAGEIELNPAAGNMPDVPRTLSWNFVQHTTVTEFDLVFEGVDAKGNSITETITEAAGWSGETSNAFATISAIKYTRQADGGDVGNIIDIGITDVLGLSNIIYETGDVYKIKKDNANAAVAAAQVDTDYDTYDMAVIGLAAGSDFTIWFKSNLNIIS